MSTCPEKDIHSVFIDGELPEIYKKDYLAHLESCPKCKKEYEKQKAIHDLLSSEADSMTLSQDELDKSFERLMAKMSYKKTISASESKIGTVVKFPQFAKNIVTAVAAAAVFAFVLPFGISLSGLKSNSNSQGIAFVDAIKRPFLKDGNVLTALEQNSEAKHDLSSLLSSNNSAQTVNFIEQNNSIADQKIIQGTPANYSNNSHTAIINTISSLQDDLAAVEVFRPDFKQEQKPVTITISLSGLAADLNNAQIQLQAAQ